MVLTKELLRCTLGDLTELLVHVHDRPAGIGDRRLVQGVFDAVELFKRGLPLALELLAARVMAERKIGCLPVVEEGTLVGILTEGDFVALVASTGC